MGRERVVRPERKAVRYERLERADRPAESYAAEGRVWPCVARYQSMFTASQVRQCPSVLVVVVFSG